VYRADHPSVTVLRDGHLVSRIADYIIYSVEAEYIDRVVEEFGPCELQSIEPVASKTKLLYERSYEIRGYSRGSDICESA